MFGRAILHSWGSRGATGCWCDKRPPGPKASSGKRQPGISCPVHRRADRDGSAGYRFGGRLCVFGWLCGNLLSPVCSRTRHWGLRPGQGMVHGVSAVLAGSDRHPCEGEGHGPGTVRRFAAVAAYAVLLPGEARLPGDITDADGRPMGPAGPTWKGRNKPHRGDRRWVTAWSPEQITDACWPSSPMMKTCGSATRRSVRRSRSRDVVRSSVSRRPVCAPDVPCGCPGREAGTRPGLMSPMRCLSVNVPPRRTTALFPDTGRTVSSSG